MNDFVCPVQQLIYVLPLWIRLGTWHQHIRQGTLFNIHHLGMSLVSVLKADLMSYWVAYRDLSILPAIVICSIEFRVTIG